jgi:signal transduction histidine kinase/ActR/RegA family two-component response regulator
MIFGGVRRSIRRKFMLVVMATTLVALLLASIALVTYDLLTYKRTWVADLSTQADILGLASAPALSFQDPKTAEENLGLLSVRPNVTAAAIYTADGRIFASYRRDSSDTTPLPAHPGPAGHEAGAREISLFRPIVTPDEQLGWVYLRARYDLTGRLLSYLAIVVGVMLASLTVAALMSVALQASVIRPILAIADVAHEVKDRRNFAARVPKTTEDETGYLVETFNDMLGQVGQRTEDLERANRRLEQEVAVRQSAEHALIEADRRKDEFLATLAHELRNPLAPLRNALHILRVAGPGSEEGKVARDIMDRQLRQLVRLVDDLLDVSRITTGKVVLQRESVPLATIIEGALETVRPFVGERGIALSVTTPQVPLMLRADPTRMAQALTNLLHNAAKFTDAGGRIELRVEREGLDGITIVVADTGIGIPADMLSFIFDMFTQLDRSLERPYSGLGVGLSLAKHLIELHGGTLEAASEGQGKGTRFTARLPGIVVFEPSPRGPHATDGGASAAPARRRVLLADDNADFTSSFALMLRSMGHDVIEAYDGAEALQAARSLQPEVAFLDIGLPKMNGYELARRLREDPATRRIVLVAVTGWGQDGDRKLAAEAGFDLHLVKPVESAQIETIFAGLGSTPLRPA